MTRPGLFVVLEGPDGSGKSTLAAAVAERMRQSGLDPVVVREPGGTHAAEIARRALLDPEHPIGPVSELFFYLAARADLVQSVIQPALAAGRVVLSDRFALTTEAYQMAGRGLPPDVVIPANRAAAHGLVPDLTLILDVDPEVAQARQVAGGKKLDRLERESAEFHRRVARFYVSVRGDGVTHLDARLPPDQLLQAAWAEILRVAPDRFGAATG
jgi:dTMP kinase